ncbi:MAG TPA: FtsX-like permease family protein [Candidatus Limnocylindrales bacterium]|nr:FtsX-like permease family protein [Candidatus Limnocylindrales bacterium]
MRRLSTLAWRSLAARRLRSILTGTGIALGVGALFAALATNAGIDASVERTVRDVIGRADLRVAAFEERGLAPETVAAIGGTPGVEVAAPIFERRTYLLQPPEAGHRSEPVTVHGIEPASYGQLHDLEVVAGAAFGSGASGEALVTEALAADEGVGVGGELTLLGAATPGPRAFRIVGLVAGNGPFYGDASRSVIVPLADAQALFERPAVDRVDLRLAPGGSLADVVSGLETRLTVQPYVIADRHDLEASLRASTADFRAMIALVATVVLFSAAFLIFNTLSMTVAERSREVGLLRAAGASRGQVYRLVLTEALLLAVAGSLAGILLGMLAAGVIAGYVRRVEGVTLGGAVLPPGAAALALLLGVAVTLAAAIEPALRAARISPVEALRAHNDPGAFQRARLRWLLAVFVVVGAAGLLLAPSDPVSGGAAAVLRALAVYGVLLAVTLALPGLVRPLGRLAAMPFGRLFRAEERLTRGALARDRSRTALTVGALAVGLTMVVALGVVARNVRLAGSEWLREVVPGDQIATSIRPVALAEGLGSQLAAVDGVARVTPVGTFDVAYQGVRLPAAAVIGADLQADGRLEMPEGGRAAALTALDQGGAVVVPRSVAQRFGIRLEDRMSFLTAGGLVELRVVGIVERSLPGRNGDSILVGWKDATEQLGVEGADFFAIRYAPGWAERAGPEVDAVARSLALQPATLERLQQAVSDALGHIFALFDAIAVVAVLIAALGVVNTLAMSVIERVREIGILRAIGMSRRQVWRMVVIEAAVLGIVGSVVGAATGVLVGVIMLLLAGSRLGVPFEPPWLTILLAIVAGVAVSILAAAYPARVAGRYSIVRAVRFE